MPYMLCSHLDVVAAIPTAWSVDPYGGVINNSYIYGRGALDDKGGVMVRFCFNFK
jgi:acetylornithine deacetylase/succinyl-diaminopimelate desuccinylase-like protein